MREVPDETQPQVEERNPEAGRLEKAMVARANAVKVARGFPSDDKLAKDKDDKMQEAMRRRSLEMKNEWEKGSTKVACFLATNNFTDVKTRRRSLITYTFPLHVAAEKSDVEMVQLLILRDADPSQKDSKGRTPYEVARKKCNKGSHISVMAQLSGSNVS